MSRQKCTRLRNHRNGLKFDRFPRHIRQKKRSRLFFERNECFAGYCSAIHTSLFIPVPVLVTPSPQLHRLALVKSEKFMPIMSGRTKKPG